MTPPSPARKNLKNKFLEFSTFSTEFSTFNTRFPHDELKEEEPVENPRRFHSPFKTPKNPENGGQSRPVRFFHKIHTPY